jgi:predicted phage terminase large subunit-like protein
MRDPLAARAAAHRLADELATRAAEARLHAFVQQAWPIIEPKAPFVDNWHIGFLCEHLEAVHLGQITDLLINIPPGCMKSVLTSVMFPAWEWGPRGRPDLRYLCGSYDEALAIRDARKGRDIITSPWYQQRFRAKPTPWTLRPDQNRKTRYDTTQSGWRIATSVGGKGTGEHPHRKIIDDPHNVKGSLSDRSRQEAITWFDLTMGSRGLALNAATIMIMQRLHEEDLAGHVLATLRDQFEHVCLCMRHEPKRMIETRLGKTDPRTTAGELLWPALLDEAKVAKLETQLRASHGEYGVAGQLQQRPAPETGGIFQRDWLQIVDAAPAAAQILRRCRGWDAAGTEGGGDWTVGARVALARDGMVYIEDVVRKQVGPGADEQLMKQTADLDGRTVTIVEEQEPGSAGKKVIAAHAKVLAGYVYRGESSSGDKVFRARPFAAQCAVGNVRLVRGEWNKVFIDELALFPHAKYDDQVDAVASAYNEIALAPETKVKPRRFSGF